jgi:adhesin transport system membrane fusion protein
LTILILISNKQKGKAIGNHRTTPIRLRAGLTATVEIKAQDRTVLSYLTKPITKTLSQSMGER